MGYGHQRTAFPLRSFAEGKILNANSYDGIPDSDRKIWKSTQRFYEFISNFKKTPIIGDFAFSIFDIFQRIISFYPKMDLSRPNLAVRQIYFLLRGGWGRHLIEKLKEKPLPLVTTFFTPAFMADYFNYPNDIFCIVCDADITRAWAPLDPSKSKIKYLAPTERVVERLGLYGVKPENIFLTGYPLPMENIGNSSLKILKEDLGNRLLNLDPGKRYFEKYRTLIEKKLPDPPKKSDHPLTLMFSVGGAGAQKEIGVRILNNLKKKIKSGEIKIIFAAGVKKKIKGYFAKNIKRMGLKKYLGKQIEVVLGDSVEDYFKNFNQSLRKTDILWTKPSELSFYSSLGLPIVIAPPIGSQEEFNMRYLVKSGFGILQENPDYTDQWLFDWLSQGYLAECAMEAFVEGRKLGVLNIKKILNS